MNFRFALMNLLAGLALLPMSAVGADTCLHKADDGPEMLRGDTVRALEVPQSSRLPGELEIVCQQRGIARINIALPAGSGRGLSLVAGRPDGQDLQPRLVDAGAWASVAVEEGPDGSIARLDMGFLAPVDGEKGEAFSGSLELFDPSSRNDEPILTIPLRLTIRGEAPLFRDQFDGFDEVDAVMGQFSLVM